MSDMDKWIKWMIVFIKVSAWIFAGLGLIAVVYQNLFM